MTPPRTSPRKRPMLIDLTSFGAPSSSPMPPPASKAASKKRPAFIDLTNSPPKSPPSKRRYLSSSSTSPPSKRDSLGRFQATPTSKTDITTPKQRQVYSQTFFSISSPPRQASDSPCSSKSSTRRSLPPLKPTRISPRTSPNFLQDGSKASPVASTSSKFSISSFKTDSSEDTPCTLPSLEALSSKSTPEVSNSPKSPISMPECEVVLEAVDWDAHQKILLKDEIKRQQQILTRKQIDMIDIKKVKCGKYIGESKKNGKFFVTDIEKEGRWYRQLYFDHNKMFIQTECLLNPSEDEDILVPYHRNMIESLRYLRGSLFKITKRENNFCVLGLGGGMLTKYLYDNFPNSKITTVDIDSSMVQVAQEYFGLPQEDERLKIVIQDAAHFLVKLDRYDVIFCDLAGNNEDKVFCPPECFTEVKLISLMWQCLDDDGLLLMNLVARDMQMRKLVRNRIERVFKAKVIVNLNEEDTMNEIIICPLYEPKKHETFREIVWTDRKKCPK